MDTDGRAPEVIRGVDTDGRAPEVMRGVGTDSRDPEVIRGVDTDGRAPQVIREGGILFNLLALLSAISSVCVTNHSTIIISRLR